MPSDRVTSRTPCASASSNTAPSQAGPSYHQWPSSSVSSAQQRRPPSLRAASAGPRDEVARVLARELERGVVVVGPPGVAPRLQVVDACGPSSCGSRRERDSRARRSRRAPPMLQSIGTATGPASVATGTQVVEAGHARSGRRRSRARRGRPARARAPARSRTPAARSRRPSRRSGAGGDAVPVATWSRRPASVAISGRSAVGRGRGPELHALERGERGHRSRPRCSNARSARV